MEYRLTTPCTAQDLAPLRAGDTVLLSGVVYTARDQAHTAWERAEALINIAHPDFREQLIADAEKMGLWRKSSKR